MTKDFGDYIYDILDAINDIEDFIRDMNFEEFQLDKKTINAVIRSLEVVGEAAKRVPDSIRNKYPSVPWRAMSGMRDKLIHQYTSVDLEIVWVVITDDIKPIKPLIQGIIIDFEAEDKD